MSPYDSKPFPTDAFHSSSMQGDQPHVVFVLTVALAIAALLMLMPSISPAKTNPYMQPDDTWLSINGKVKSVSADSFMLDYGKGLITVEMDDGDRDADAYKLVEGDEVTVYGMTDDDLYQTTKIEASSVYVKNLETYFVVTLASY